MSEMTRIINGVQITDITPELTEEETIERANNIVRGIMSIKEKEKTA